MINHLTLTLQSKLTRVCADGVQETSFSLLQDGVAAHYSSSDEGKS